MAGGWGVPCVPAHSRIFLSTSVMPPVLVISPNSRQTPRTHTEPREHTHAHAPANPICHGCLLWGGLSALGIYTNTAKPARQNPKGLPPVIPHIYKPDKKRPRLTRGGARLERVREETTPPHGFAKLRRDTVNLHISACLTAAKVVNLDGVTVLFQSG